MRFILVLFFLALSSCAEVRYVQVPEELTKPCEKHQVQEQSLDEAIRLANERKESVTDCNDRMDKIRAIQGTPVKK